MVFEIGSYSPKRDEFKDNILVCYCFEYTRKDIEKDYLDNGRLTIFERIIFDKKAGQCDCTQKNPKGR